MQTHRQKSFGRETLPTPSQMYPFKGIAHETFYKANKIQVGLNSSLLHTTSRKFTGVTAAIHVTHYT